MPGRSPDLFDDAEAKPASPYARSTLDRLNFTLRLREKGFRDTALLRAFELVPRESFAPRRFADLARRDMALPLPCGQTMTAPLVLARLMSLAAIESKHRVLEIGAGSGYATAILAHLAGEVVTVERFKSLAVEAEGKLRALAPSNVALLHADGLQGVARGVFDRIFVDARMKAWPARLIEQLAPGGAIVATIVENEISRLARLRLQASGEIHQESFEMSSAAPLQEGRAEAL
ncbi:MAG: rRNA adenine N-6-methyltransferase family protein [Beijerinckiaceae bacterium]